MQIKLPTVWQYSNGSTHSHIHSHTHTACCRHTERPHKPEESSRTMTGHIQKMGASSDAWPFPRGMEGNNQTILSRAPPHSKGKSSILEYMVQLYSELHNAACLAYSGFHIMMSICTNLLTHMPFILLGENVDESKMEAWVPVLNNYYNIPTLQVGFVTS